MKLTIEVEDKEEFISALNNAIIALGNIASTAMFALNLPANFEQMLIKKVGPDPDDQYNFLRSRIELLKDVYFQLESEDKKEPNK